MIGLDPGNRILLKGHVSANGFSFYTCKMETVRFLFWTESSGCVILGDNSLFFRAIRFFRQALKRATHSKSCSKDFNLLLSLKLLEDIG